MADSMKAAVPSTSPPPALREQTLPSFPYPWRDREQNEAVGAEIRTLKEQTMVSLSQAIRKKSQWETKLSDPWIVANWRANALLQGTTRDIIDYVLDELLYYKSLKDGAVEPSVVDGVWQADSLIPDQLRLELIDGVKPLENVPEKEKDWHPGSNNQVLDLVHPSLYCLVFGKTTRIRTACLPSLPFMGQGEIIPQPYKHTAQKVYRAAMTESEWASNKYQWLPSEFVVSPEGKVTIASYINNLHPIRHKGLYRTVGAVFERMVPLFEKSLTTISAYPYLNRLSVPDGLTFYDEDDSDNDDDTRDEAWFAAQIPVPSEVVPILTPKNSEPVCLRGRKLQVIVKLANIELTPESPKYAGGSWHVEGMINEHIVASGIYYYSSENITESVLEFRQAVAEPAQQSHNGFFTISRTYGLHSYGDLNQGLGGVVTQQGRAIVFPNIFQHQTQPFKLLDPTKPGHRKILVFFLVDPNHRVQSTITVPPQQGTWASDWLRTQIPAFRRLPREVTELIAKHAGWPMSLDEAKKYRDELMEVRRLLWD